MLQWLFRDLFVGITELLSLVRVISAQGVSFMSAIDDLKASQAANAAAIDTLVGSVDALAASHATLIARVTDLAAQLLAAGSDPATIKAVVDGLNAATAKAQDEATKAQAETAATPS